MSRVSGILLLDKPAGWTSHDLVMRTRRTLGQKEVGHAGTLDPLATGLMILLLGDATKMSNFLLEADKAYEVRVKFGLETDSLDITGAIVAQTSVMPAEQKIRDAIFGLSGEIELPIPKFSAVKRNGVKLCDAVRRGEEVVSPLRKMKFYNLNVKSIDSESATVALGCSKGSYIRSWSHRLGQILGCGAVVEGLIRTHSEPYTLAEGMSFQRFEEVACSFDEKSDVLTELGSSFVPLAELLPHWKVLTVNGRDERLVLNGQIPNDITRRLIPEQKEANRLNRPLGIKILSGQAGHLLSLLEARPKEGLKIRRVFNRSL